MTVKRGHTNTDKWTIYPYDYIFADGSDLKEKVTICLPKPFLRMLQSQSARYLWYDSYRLDGERIELNDLERSALISGNYNLIFGGIDGCLLDFPQPPIEQQECEIVKHYHDTMRCIMCMYCGTNCGCDSNQYCQPPEQPNPDESPFPPTASPDPGDNQQDSEWCRRYSWFVATWVGTIGAIDGGAAAGIELTVAWLSALITQKLGQLGLVLAGILATVSSWLISNTAWQGMYNAVNQPEVLTALVCAIYNANSPLEAKEAFKEVVRQTNHTWYQGLLLNLWRGVIDWNALFSDTVWLAMETAFPTIKSTPLNCMCDGSPPPIPPGEGDEVPTAVTGEPGWYLVPTTMINITAGSNASLVNGGFQHYYNAAHPSKDNTNAYCQLDSEFLTVDLITESGLIGLRTNFAGFVFEIIASDNTRLGHFADVGMVKLEPEELQAYDVILYSQTGSALDGADVLAALITMYPAADILHKGSKDFIEAGRDVLRYRMDTGGESGNVMIVWAVVESTYVILP